MTLKAPGVVFGALLTTCFAGACSSSPAKTTGSGGDGSASDDTGPSRASAVSSNGYVTTGPWAGYGFTATDPGAATISPDLVGSDLCMQGNVTGRPDYTGFAMLGWNLNQLATTGAAMNTWAVPATGGVTVTVLDNPPSVALRVQLQGTDPHSGADRWCAPLVNGQPLAWGDFKTNCYTGGTPQNPLTAGTMLQQGSVLVPGLLTDLPFDVCVLDIQIQP
jgi:hypothetical protein